MKFSFPLLFLILSALATAHAVEADPPAVTLGDDDGLRAEVLLPDAANGFYRGSRFSWAGMIRSLQCDGHRYFAAWSSGEEPFTNHGAGPATEFDLPDPETGIVAPPGFAEAGPGGLFLKIGVGWLRRDNEAQYHPFRPYEIADAGTWRVGREGNTVTMTHDLPVRNGLGCLYRKEISLDPLRRALTITETVRNIGTRMIDTVGYCHNFLNLDGTPISRAYCFSMIPALDPAEPLPPVLQRRGEQWIFSDVLTDQLFLAFPTPEGSGFRVRVHNNVTGGRLEIRTSEKIRAFRLFADPAVLCPETFVAARLLPGEEKTWSWQYLFQSSPSSQPRSKTRP